MTQSSNTHERFDHRNIVDFYSRGDRATVYFSTNSELSDEPYNLVMETVHHVVRKDFKPRSLDQLTTVDVNAKDATYHGSIEFHCQTPWGPVEFHFTITLGRAVDETALDECLLELADTVILELRGLTPGDLPGSDLNVLATCADPGALHYPQGRTPQEYDNTPPTAQVLAVISTKSGIPVEDLFVGKLLDF